jgi:hypothetical protein
MPPSGDRLTPEQIGLLRAWIDQGAVWAEEPPAASDKAKEQKQVKDHWAFLAPKRSAPPKVKDRKWIHNPIDTFVLSRLEAEKILAKHPQPFVIKNPLCSPTSPVHTILCETVGDTPDLFAVFDKKNRFYVKRSVASVGLFELDGATPDAVITDILKSADVPR